MTNQLFEKSKPIIQTIIDHGFEAYFVGGSIRDYLMNREIHDIDITTSATPNEIESLFNHTIPIGKEHGTINVVYNNENYEVTTFRVEDEYVNHRRPNEVYFVRELYQDLQRRDFTINAIAMDINYKIIDYFNGKQDIQEQIIRTVGEPIDRFKEDSLRIVRALRFESQLNFSIDTKTYQAMETQISDISFLSIERIVIEFKKLIKGPNISATYQNLIKLNAFNYIPFFKASNANQLNIDTPINFDLWLALIVYTSNNELPLSELKISNQEKMHIKQYCQILKLLPSISTKKALRMLVYDFDMKDILELLNHKRLLDKNHVSTGNTIIINSKSLNEINNQLVIKSRKDIMINGNDLIQYFNKKSGPWLKSTLREIEYAIVNQEVKNMKNEILKWVENHVEI